MQTQTRERVSSYLVFANVMNGACKMAELEREQDAKEYAETIKAEYNLKRVWVEKAF